MTLRLPCDLDSLQAGVADAWQSFDVATVNGNTVRFSRDGEHEGELARS